MLRVCEKLREADDKGRRYGLARAETGYLRALVNAMADTDRLAEVELLKTLGDVNVEKGRLGKDVGKFNTALALYIAAMVRCYHEEQADGIEHRYHYTERLLQGVSSYRRYIQTADRDLGKGHLDAAETNLEDALKLVHDRSKPNKAKEADCLCRLGDVYVERGKRTGEGRKFTQAAALYNASMARTDGDKQNMVTKLQETERQFLRNTCNLDCEPCPYSSALNHRKEVDNSRARAKSQLEAIHQEHNPYQYDEDDPVVREVEIKRAEAIKNLFKSIAAERREFIQVLTDECIAKLGPPPCKYAFIGMGSQATELVTPYSDLEFAILIEEGKDDDDDDTRRYFLNLTHYLHLKVINLGETILPAMAIPSLNDFLSEDPEKDWFFDSVTPRGFAFDGFMPWASKTPFGREETKSKPSVSLIQTPAKLAEYQHLHIALAEGYHLSDILRRVTYLTGDESLVDEYVDRVNKTLDRSPVLSRLSVSFEDDIRQIEKLEPTGQVMNVKKEIYRFPSVAVDVLSICCGITIPSVWRTIEELHKTQRISHEDAHHLTVLISISAELRLRTYIANEGQKDKTTPHPGIPKSLNNIGSCWNKLGDHRKAISYYGQSLKMMKAIYGETTPHPEIAGSLNNIGTCWNKLGDHRKAISYYGQSLKMMKAIYGETMPHPSIALSLNNIGICWEEVGDYRTAMRYYEQSLDLMKAIYGDDTSHPNIAIVLKNIRLCKNALHN
ncbi:PREDICTED: uncharacterized protein LOC109487941 [Branchiostoma belcheri]|uniref:Uncharacterized protein LOC109487941 n=1 Tax=Branchiostoma belcheri TaxID=7741 RepID=A0A6P5AX25_BRABE|nr:PREDICTED: uncharacterized protein LOC109487941 [Branchiostoma belcheri]